MNTGSKPRSYTYRKRRRAMRAETLIIKRLSKRALTAGALVADVELAALRDLGISIDRPATRAECAQGDRPCPFVSCKYHLFLDVSPHTGNIKFNFPDLEVDELPVSCALDVADRDGETLEEVGAIMNITRERIRQIEVVALRKVSERGAALREHAGPGRVPVRRLPIVKPGG